MSRKPTPVRTSSGEPESSAPAPAGSAPTDAALLAAVAGGDREAFAALYDRHSAAVFGFIRRLMGQTREAEDVLQETFWQVWRQADRFSADRGSPRTWLLLIARSRSIDHLRRQRARGKVEAPLGPRAAEAAGDPGRDDDDDEDAPPKDVVDAALDTLPDEQRHAIDLAFFGGLTHREIAERLDEPLGTVKTRIRLGMGKLREHLLRKGRIGRGEA